MTCIASEVLAVAFLACWLEYRSDLPAARAFVAQVIAERTQRSREFGIKWRKRWYNPKISDRLHEISIRESPFLARLRAEQEPRETVRTQLVEWP